MLVAGARNTTASQKDLSNYDANMAHIDKLFSPKHFAKYILGDFSEIENYILEARLDELQIRFNVWRVLLGVFKPTDTPEQKVQALNKSRQTYDDLYKKYLKSDPTPTGQNIKRDPLSRDTGNGMWNNYFENSELKNEVKKDVDRTYSDKEFF